jgi:hypothetical protein
VGVKFWKHIPNSLRNKNLERLIQNLLEKVVLLTSKTLQSPLGTGKKTFSLTLNVKISQMVRNECLKFGVHVDIQIRYKDLTVENTKSNLHFCTNHLAFKRGCFEAILTRNTLCALGVNPPKHPRPR